MVKQIVTRKPASKVKSTLSKSPWYASYVKQNGELLRYMRDEWGFEKRGEKSLFEKLCLEGQMAGLNWAMLLAKRATYRKVFHGFDIAKCAAMTEKHVDRILSAAAAGPGGRDSVVRNRAKLLSISNNARCVQALRTKPYKDLATGKLHRKLNTLLWGFVGDKAKLNSWKSSREVPALTPTAEAMSKALKKLGFAFVGPTSCYSLMQSCGLVIDHPKGTPEHRAASERIRKRCY